MDNKKFELFEFIELKKQKGKNRKPKYAMRKLTIGLVSCMLGFIVLGSPVESLAAETSTKIEASEDELGKKSDEENKEKLDKQDKKTDEVKKDESDNQDKGTEELKEEAKKEAEELEAAKADAKSKFLLPMKKQKSQKKHLKIITRQ